MRWDEKVLEDELGPIADSCWIRIIMVDEKAIWKHHGCVAVKLNVETGKLLHMAKGKKKAFHARILSNYIAKISRTLVRISTK